VIVQPKAREAVCVALRTVLIRDDRDEIAQEILRYGLYRSWLGNVRI
jgi:Arc/MetJ family transcription regulator